MCCVLQYTYYTKKEGRLDPLVDSLSVAHYLVLRRTFLPSKGFCGFTACGAGGVGAATGAGGVGAAGAGASAFPLIKSPNLLMVLVCFFSIYATSSTNSPRIFLFIFLLRTLFTKALLIFALVAPSSTSNSVSLDRAAADIP